MAISPKLKQLIGRSTPPAAYEVEKSQVRRFAVAIGEENPIHSDEKAAQAAGHTGLVGSPTFAAVFIHVESLLEEAGIDPIGVMHAEEEYEYFRPICAGDTVVVTHRVVDIYDKEAPNGRLVFLVIETRGVDRRERPVFKARRVLVDLKK